MGYAAVNFNLGNQHYSKDVDNYIVYNKEYVYAWILLTNDQTNWTSTSFECFSRSTAFIVDFTWEVNYTQLCNNYRPISIVQYRRILYGHVVWMVRCDWPFTVGYIINATIGIQANVKCIWVRPYVIMKRVCQYFTWQYMGNTWFNQRLACIYLYIYY